MLKNLNISNIAKKTTVGFLIFSTSALFLYPLSTEAGSIFDMSNNTGTINTGSQSNIIQNPYNSSFVPIQEKPALVIPDDIKVKSTGDAQADATESGGSGGAAPAGGGGGAADALGCSASGLLGQAISSGLKSLVGKTVAKTAGALKNVPIIANATGDNLDVAKNAAEANASVNAIQQINGIPIGASFNGIAYCIVNGIIQYVAQSTIAWAKSGFKGNPAFLENPQAFFQTLADNQANQFISGVAYNTNGANACEPFRTDLGVALSESYGNQIPGGGAAPAQISCTMGGQQGGAGGGVGGSGVQVIPAPGNGGPQQGGGGSGGGFWSSWNSTRQGGNNLAGAFLKASSYLKKQINTKQEVTKQEVSNNNGYLNFKKCEDNKAAKKGDTSSCKTTTPGSLIQSGLQSTLDLGKKRLVDAGKIDQLITSITNALIKKALNTVLDKGQ